MSDQIQQAIDLDTINPGLTLDMLSFGPVELTTSTTAALPTDSRPYANIPLQPPHQIIDRLLFGQFVERQQPPALKKRKIGKYLYLPTSDNLQDMETKARLGHEMIGKGFQVLVGDAAAMSRGKWGDLPPGIVLFSSLTGADARTFFHAAQAGHINVVYDERLPAMLDEPRITRAWCNPYAMKLCDHIFAETEATAKSLRAVTSNNVMVTGPLSVPVTPTVGDKIVMVCDTVLDTQVPEHHGGFETYARAFLNSGDTKPSDELVALLREQVDHAEKWRDVAHACADAIGAAFPNVVYGREHLASAACVVFIAGDSAGYEARHVPLVRIGHGGFCKPLGVEVVTPEAAVSAVRAALNGTLWAKVVPPRASAAQFLYSIWEKNKYPMPFSLIRAWEKRGPFNAADDNGSKFGGYSSTLFEKWVGNGRRVDWGLWLMEAGQSLLADQLRAAGISPENIK